MKKRTVILASGFLLILLGGYISVEFWIANDVKDIVESGMKNDTTYKDYMTKSAYSKINPLKRGLKNYELQYNPDNHSYSHIRTLHLFAIALATINHRYRGGNMGFNETITLTLKLRKGTWIATDVKIRP